MRSLVLAALLCFLIGQAKASAPCIISTESFPPYFAPNLEQNGWLTDVVLAALYQQGIECRVEFTQWRRALELAKRGKRTAVLGGFYSDERARNFHHSRAIAVAHSSLFKHKDSTFHFNGDLSSLDGYVIAKGKGYIVEDKFDKHTELALVYTDDLKQGLELLSKKRVDLVAGPKETGLYWINTPARGSTHRLSSKLTVDPTPLARHTMHLLFPRTNKGAARYKNQFNTGLTTIANNGLLAKILSRHGFSEQKIERYIALIQAAGDPE